MGGYNTTSSERDIQKSISLGTLFLLITVLLLPQILPPPAQAEIPPTWNDSDWDYRRVIKLTENSGSTLTDFPVEITLTPNTFTYNRIKGSSGEDIRFTTSSGTACSYWIETWNTSGTSTVWLEAPSIPASGTTNVYMYYGNSAAGAVSSGTDTFTFFDDFPGSSLDATKWSGTETGFSVTGGQLKGTDTTGRIQSINTYSQPVVQEAKTKTITRATNGHHVAGFYNSGSDCFGATSHPTLEWVRNDTTWTSIGSPVIDLDTWYIVRISAGSLTCPHSLYHL